MPSGPPYSPGFAHSDFNVSGLVSDIDIGRWNNPVKRNSSFGLNGTSPIEGGLQIREISFQMIFFSAAGFPSVSARDSQLFLLELYIGNVGALLAVSPSEILLSIPQNVRFAPFEWGKAGVDNVHGYYREMFFHFEQLAPATLQQDEEEAEDDEEGGDAEDGDA